MTNTTETHTIHSTRTEYAGTLRDRAAREHADRIGGVVVGQKTPEPAVYASADAWMRGEAPVAVYRAAK